MNSVFRFKKIDSNIYNTQKRFLNLHEYQSHDLFRKYNITVPRGREARSVDEAVEIAKSFGGMFIIHLQLFNLIMRDIKLKG